MKTCSTGLGKHIDVVQVAAKILLEEIEMRELTDSTIFHFGLYRIELLAQRPEDVVRSTDATLYLLTQGSDATCFPLASTITSRRVQDAIRALQREPLGHTKVLRERTPRWRTWGDIVVMLDPAKISWADLTSLALRALHERGYHTASIVLERPTDPVARGSERTRVAAIAQDVCDASERFFQRHPRTLLSTVRLLSKSQPELIAALRDLYACCFQARLAQGAPVAN